MRLMAGVVEDGGKGRGKRKKGKGKNAHWASLWGRWMEGECWIPPSPASLSASIASFVRRTIGLPLTAPVQSEAPAEALVTVDDLDTATFAGNGKKKKHPFEPEPIQKPEPKVVVYGHFAKKGLDMRKWTKGLDSGCVKGGELSALVVEIGGGEERVVSVGCKEGGY